MVEQLGKKMILSIEDESPVVKNGKNMKRFIFSNDKIVYVEDESGIVYPTDTSDKYIDLINVYLASGTSTSKKKKYDQVGGWLAFFVVTLCLGGVYSIINGMISDGISVSDCTRVFGSTYTGECANMVDIFNAEKVCNVLFGVIRFILAIMITCCYKKSSKITFWFLIILGCVIILDIGFAISVMSSLHMSIDPKTIAKAFGGLIYIITWSIYLYKSERVKHTLSPVGK